MQPIAPPSPKAIPTPNPGTWGIVSAGEVGGGIFRDTDGDVEGWLGVDGYGVRGFGSTAGGEFRSTLFSGVAALGYGDYGIYAAGDAAGGFFADHVTASYAEVGALGHGIKAQGSVVGGEFTHAGALSSASIAAGGTGIHAVGAESGGFFEHTTGTGSAYVGYGNRGLHAIGSDMGGYFEHTDGKDKSGSPNAGDYGVYGGGGYAGAYFENAGDFSYVYLASDGWGVFAKSDGGGGVFEHTSSRSWGAVGVDTSKIYGVGALDFVQNHPLDPDTVIVYAAPEGDEVATYTRGTATLAGGEARVPLGETFKWVTNPDIGLTAYLTPVGDWCDLYAAEKGAHKIVVRTRNGNQPRAHRFRCASDMIAG